MFKERHFACFQTACDVSYVYYSLYINIYYVYVYYIQATLLLSAILLITSIQLKLGLFQLCTYSHACVNCK